MKPIRCATFLSFLILAVVLSVSQAQATDVSVPGGTITENSIWNLKKDYSLFISGNITVGAAGTLTVKPGTVVKFDQWRGMWIDGLLDAQGTSSAPIYFTDWRDDTKGRDANNNSTVNSPSPPSAFYFSGAGFFERPFHTVSFKSKLDQNVDPERRPRT